jgi:SPOR domain
MKALFLALLLTNLIVLAWTQWHAPAKPAAPAAEASPVPTLQLAAESSPQSEPTKPPDAGPPETTSQPAQTPGEPAPAPQSSAALINDVARCISLGPFRDLAEASQASSTMRSSGYAPRTRLAQGDVWAGLWVYLADLPSRAEAQRAMSVLKQKGIADAYIMPAADQTNVISLGIFSEPQRAQRRAEEVKALGFTPSIADRTRKDTVYWIDIDLKPTDAMVNPSDLPSESGRIVRLQVVACPSAPGAPG